MDDVAVESEFESLIDQLDEFDVEDDIDDEERFRRSISRLRPRGGGYVRPRPTARYVTQPQLQAALARVGADIRKNTGAITAVGKRVSAVAKKTDRDIAAIKKVNTKQSADIAKARETAILTMLLSKPKSVALRNGVDAIPAGTKVVVEDAKGSSMLLPLLLMGDSGSGGSDNSLLLALAVSGSL